MEHRQSWWSWTALLFGGQDNKLYPVPNLKEKKIGGITFILTFVQHSYCLFALTVLQV